MILENFLPKRLSQIFPFPSASQHTAGYAFREFLVLIDFMQI